MSMSMGIPPDGAGGGGGGLGRMEVSQMVTYLVCDELKYGFKSAYEQS